MFLVIQGFFKVFFFLHDLRVFLIIHHGYNIDRILSISLGFGKEVGNCFSIKLVSY